MIGRLLKKLWNPIYLTAAETYQELNEVTAVYRKNPNVQQANIKCSDDVAEMARKIWPVDINHREAMAAIYLNNANKNLRL